MCGLIGVAGNVTPAIRDVVSELLLVDVVRGHHSTGMAAVRKFESEVVLLKAPIASPIFIGTKEYQELMKQQNMKAYIGHNRYATIGAKDEQNAHPFKFSEVVGAHNGTIDDYARKQILDWEAFGTDSEAIFNSINSLGVKETVGKLTGAWALTWFAKEANTINLLRNSKRPLHYTYSADRETLFWASEADMLAWVLKRHNIKMFDDDIFEAEADVHYKWEVPTKHAQKFEKPLVQKIEGSKVTYVAPVKKWENENANWAQVYGGYADCDPKYVGKHAGSSYTTYPDQRSKAGNGAVIHLPAGPSVGKFQPLNASKINTTKFRPPYKDAYGTIINKEKFLKLVASGCVYCDGTDSEFGEFIHCLKDDVDGRKLYLCEECYNDDDVRLVIQNVC